MLIPLSTITNSLLRKRRLQQRHGSTITDGTGYEVFSVAGKHVYTVAPTLKLAIQRAQELADTDTVVSVWSPLRAHIYMATIQNGQYTVLHGAKS